MTTDISARGKAVFYRLYLTYQSLYVSLQKNKFLLLFTVTVSSV